ncbi:MAG: cytochrome c biogenesis protein ResB, partial [Coriobacteriia bacterium]|nr:cytochrome c biogenesis protein ResB [Coriobacteriia bacterium]
MTSRRTSIALMAFVAFFGALGAWIPQSSLGQAEVAAVWCRDNPFAARVAEALGLYNIFSSWWFVAVTAVFVVVLAIATSRLLRDAWGTSRHPGRVPRTLLPGADLQRVLERARAAG